MGTILQTVPRMDYYLQIFSEHELSPFYGPTSVLGAEDTKVGKVQSSLQNAVSPHRKSTDCLQYTSSLCLLFGYDLGIIIGACWVTLRNTR